MFVSAQYGPSFQSWTFVCPLSAGSVPLRTHCSHSFFVVRFEKVNASVGNVYLYKGMGKEFNRGIVDMENQTLP